MTQPTKKSHKKGVTSQSGLFVRNDTHCRSFQAKNHILNSRRIKFRLMKKFRITHAPRFKPEHSQQLGWSHHPEQRQKRSRASRVESAINPKRATQNVKVKKIIEICRISLQIRANNAIHIIRLPPSLYGLHGPRFKRDSPSNAHTKSSKTKIDSVL
ncbi:hypothetical protein [Desulfomicrobium baculatum]|uniref:hypothetical protein n=1 Tax=Desulfomicrobium baculatum TaxID=899 RepID=UPI00117F21F4|nr:hypothetical protein [Desulfomicrobium baculatum]